MSILNNLSKTHLIRMDKSLLLLNNSNYKIIRVREYNKAIFVSSIRESVGIKHFIAIFHDKTIDRISSHQCNLPKNIFKKDFYSENDKDCFFNMGVVK